MMMVVFVDDKSFGMAQEYNDNDFNWPGGDCVAGGCMKIIAAVSCIDFVAEPWPQQII